MRIMTANIPQEYLNMIEKLVEIGLFPSRSEAIRMAVHNWLITKIEDLISFRKLVDSKKQSKDQIVGDKVIINGKTYKIKQTDS